MPNDTKDETFGQRLERLRDAAGMSRRALAEKIGVKWGQHVFGWEREGRQPRDESIFGKIAAVLGVSETYLRTGREAGASEAVTKETFMKRIAELFGVSPGQIVIQIHGRD
jgi:transcriptional regulator with XRE-family HTH domain